MIGRDRVVRRGHALPDVLGPLGQAVDRPARGLQHLAGAADQLAGDQEREQHVGDPGELAGPGDQVVLVAAVGVAGRVGVVLEQVDVAADALVDEPALGVDEQVLEDPLAGLVVRDQLAQRVALGRRVLGVAADVQVEPGPVAQEHVRRAAPRHHAAEQVARHLVRGQASLAVEGAGDPELGLHTVDPPLHLVSVGGEAPPCHSCDAGSPSAVGRCAVGSAPCLPTSDGRATT